MTFSVMAECNYAQCHLQALCAECHYAECRYADCRGAQNPLRLEKLSCPNVHFSEYIIKQML